MKTECNTRPLQISTSLHRMTKSKLQRFIAKLNRVAAYLAKNYREESDDLRPWVSADPAASAHWMVIQSRIDLQHELRQWGRIHKRSQMPHKRTRLKSVPSGKQWTTVRPSAFSPSADFNRIENSRTKGKMLTCFYFSQV